MVRKKISVGVKAALIIAAGGIIAVVIQHYWATGSTPRQDGSNLMAAETPQLPMQQCQQWYLRVTGFEVVPEPKASSPLSAEDIPFRLNTQVNDFTFSWPTRSPYWTGTSANYIIESVALPVNQSAYTVFFYTYSSRALLTGFNANSMATNTIFGGQSAYTATNAITGQSSTPIMINSANLPYHGTVSVGLPPLFSQENANQSDIGHITVNYEITTNTF